MKTKVLMIDGDTEIGEVSNVNELVDLLKQHRLSPDDIWFSIPDEKMWDELIEIWSKQQTAYITIE